MVFTTPYKSRSRTERPTEKSEAIHPFANTPSPRGQKTSNITNPGESHGLMARRCSALIQFDTRNSLSGLYVGRKPNSYGLSMTGASSTRWISYKAEEVIFEPSAGDTPFSFASTTLSARNSKIGTSRTLSMHISCDLDIPTG